MESRQHLSESQRAVLVQQAAGGDADALQRLILEYHAPLYRIIERQMDAVLRRVLDPDDILQQAYIAAFKSVAGSTFTGPAAFYKWLERIALDRLADARRDAHRFKRDIGRVAADGSPSSYYSEH